MKIKFNREVKGTQIIRGGNPTGITYYCKDTDSGISVEAVYNGGSFMEFQTQMIQALTDKINAQITVEQKDENSFWAKYIEDALNDPDNKRIFGKKALLDLFSDDSD